MVAQVGFVWWSNETRFHQRNVRDDLIKQLRDDECTPLEGPSIMLSRSPPPENDYSKKKFFLRCADAHGRPNAVGITVAVQFSIDRLERFFRMGQSWGGHVSAAIFIPYIEGSVEAEWCLAHLKDRNEKLMILQRTQKRTLFTWDVGVMFAREEDVATGNTVHSAKDLYDKLYPVNALRNLALDQVETDLVLLVDVDFWFSSGAVYAANGQSTTWKVPLCEIRNFAKKGKGLLGVVPAFESARDHDPPRDFQALVSDLSNGLVDRFYGNRYRIYCPTNYGQWLQTNISYTIDYGKGFEPYVVAPTMLLPWFSEDFKGFYGDRELYLWTLAAKGWEFMVLPSHFIVHEWHADSKSKNATRGNAQLYRFAMTIRHKYMKQVLRNDDARQPGKWWKWASYTKNPIRNNGNSPDGMYVFKSEIPCSPFMNSLELFLSHMGWYS